MRIQMKGGDEYDALSRKSKGLHRWRSGERKALKRKYNKRVRKTSFVGGRSGFDRQLKANGEPSMNADVKRWFKTIVANDDNYYGDYALAA